MGGRLHPQFEGGRQRSVRAPATYDFVVVTRRQIAIMSARTAAALGVSSSRPSVTRSTVSFM